MTIKQIDALIAELTDAERNEAYAVSENQSADTIRKYAAANDAARKALRDGLIELARESFLAGVAWCEGLELGSDRLDAPPAAGQYVASLERPMDLKTKTTAELLQLLASRTVRKIVVQREHYRGDYSDSDDESLIDDIALTLGRRIDGLEKGPPDPKKPWEELP